MSDLGETSNVLSGRKEKVLEDFSVKNIFIISLFVGALGIISGVLFNSTAISLLIPMSVMAFYIYITLTKDTDLPITVVGDSYYYQGFVFTLIALMASLFSLGINEQVNMNSMVASFGAALITTIIGLVARLYVTSFSIEAQKRREHLENQIEKSLDKFSAQIDTLTQQVVTSINKVHAQTENTLTETLSNYSDINSKVLNEYKDTMSSNMELINQGMETVSLKLSNIELSPDIISKPLNKTLKDLLKPLSEYELKYVEVNDNFKLLADKLISQYEASGSQLDVHVNKLETALNDTISVQTQKYNSNLNTISEGIISSLSDITDLKLETQDAVESKLKELSTGIEIIVNTLNTSIKPVSQASHSLEELSSKVTDSITLVSDKTGHLTELMSQSIDSYSDIEGLSKNLSNLLKTIEEFDTSMKGVISVNNEASTRISSSASATEDATHQLAKDISEVYKQLTIQVRALRSS